MKRALATALLLTGGALALAGCYAPEPYAYNTYYPYAYSYSYPSDYGSYAPYSSAPECHGMGTCDEISNGSHLQPNYSGGP
ncbi:MAG TPA: hypothetical protein VL993_04960 [Stellaceae bacterium]|nr:hypothetical protein [Stellaceae bacterium]